MIDILIYGWYNQGNYGDEWFKHTFQTLFSGLNLLFTFDLNKVAQQQYKYMIIGGGNIVNKNLAEVLKNVKIPYEFWSISLSNENERELLIKPEKVIVRDTKSYKYLKDNFNTFLLPDINFLTPPFENTSKNENGIVIIPNSNVVPNNKTELPKFLEYHRFCTELSRYIDETKQELKFVSLQSTDAYDDNYIYYATKSYSLNKKFTCSKNEEEFKNFILNSKYMISMRYHGLVLGILYNKPTMCIGFHSKLKTFCEDFDLPYINYYEFSKNRIPENLENTKKNLSQKGLEFLNKKGEYHDFSKLIREKIK